MKIISNIFFAFPIFLSVYYGLYFESIIIILSVFASLFYHFYDEKRLYSLDNAAALILIASNLYLCYLANFRWPFFHLALMAVAVGFYFFFKAQKENYNLNHSIWHLACMLITTLSIFAYSW